MADDILDQIDAFIYAWTLAGYRKMPVIRFKRFQDFLILNGRLGPQPFTPYVPGEPLSRTIHGLEFRYA